MLTDGGVTVNAFHPGIVGTTFLGNNGLLGRLMNIGLRIIGISPDAGAQTGIYLATSPEVEGITGRYFFKKRPVLSSPISYDKSIGEQLWKISTNLTESVERIRQTT
jgi:hypothetical protein